MTLPIPVAALTQHVIALGKTRSGKSSKLRVCVEWLLDNDNPTCIIDPKGDWWGLKSSADGKESGYPIVVFGGEHADVPINAHSGAHIAELWATGNRSCLIDLGGWMIGERTRFFIDFASTLFKLTRGRRYLVMPEAHNFCPKGKIFDPDAGKMLHWANRLASEGLGKGIVILADSQRPQKVHNDYLTSCETLIACKVMHKADRDAIKDWIDGCADPGVGKQVLDTIAGMQKPEAWVWSPEVGFGPKLITWPMFKTYDSFKPQDAHAGKLKGWADVDLDEVKAKLATVVEEAKANDPKALKARIAELERQIKAGAQPAAAALRGYSKEHLIQACDRAECEGFERGYKEGFEALANSARVALLKMVEANDTVVAGMESILAQIRKTPRAPAQNPAAADSNARRIRNPEPVRAAPAAARGNGAVGGGDLPKCERSILTVLSQYPEGCEIGKLTLLTGYRLTGGFRNSLSALRVAGLIDGENAGTMRITESGLARGPFEELPTGEALAQHWLNSPRFDLCAKKILGALLEHPQGLTADQLCEATGYRLTGGFRNSLSALRTAGVLVGKNTGVMTASEELLNG